MLKSTGLISSPSLSAQAPPFAALLTILAAIALTIEATGGFPSQLAHLYYVPVVVSALLLKPRFAMAIAVAAVLLVSPAVDVIHSLLELPFYFDDPEPWHLGQSGWIMRPIAFLTISLVGSRYSESRIAKMQEALRIEAREEELRALSRIDKMILSGAGEVQSIEEIARFVIELTGAKFAGIVTPSFNGKREMSFRGYTRDAGGQPQLVFNDHRPYGEGVTGWALMHGRTAWTRDIFEDPRYQRMAEIAREGGYRSAAAAAIVLDGEILGALTFGREEPRDFDSDEIAALERIADQAAVAVANARQREALQNIGLETAMVLSNVIETRDAYTGDHCRRLVAYAASTAEMLKLTTKEIDQIKLGAALHDVGKIVVPDSILMKTDKLTPDEYAQIKQHCYVGGQICKKIPFLRSVQDIVYHHHEFWDGFGYPDGLSGERIPLGARIVAVVDAYDAMTSDRPYRAALPRDHAYDTLIAGAGTQWDPDIVRCFLAGIKGDFDRLKEVA